MVTNLRFNRLPRDRTAAKSFRRCSRRSDPKRRSAVLCSGSEFAPSLRTSRAENPPTSLGGHARTETVTSFAFEIARLKSAFHRTVLAPGEDSPKSPTSGQPKRRQSTTARGAVSIRPAEQQQFPLAGLVVACGGLEPLGWECSDRSGERSPSQCRAVLTSRLPLPLNNLLVAPPVTAPSAITRCHRPQASSDGSRRRWPRRAPPSPGADSRGTARAAAPRSSAPVRPCDGPPGTGCSTAAGTGR